ncbi:MAG: sulfite exporter TauE/SafE family protein [Bacteroidota bacterium]|nr:sulfite exporter TauE/SafE family protein [Candidatus Kapabacteria bacterium]MDW8219640.1 sulfite exporter TauE/SafE family protein [Bacteroidota bacterium]
MILAACALGFVGSFHCVAMCAPLTLAFKMGTCPNWQYYRERILYNLGRTVTYTVLGLAVGSIKELLGMALFDIHTFQEILSLGVGVAILAWVVVPYNMRIRLVHMPILRTIMMMLKQRMQCAMNKQSRSLRYCILGMLNGLLPCGFVYMGLGFAMLSGNILNAAFSMALFGLGTMPAMMLTAVFARIGTHSIRYTGRIRHYASVGTVCIAILLIIRGLALDIPYISPKLTAYPAGVERGCTPGMLPSKP